jgi:hypothetical protein
VHATVGAKSVLMTWDEMPETSRTWRVRARLADRPGALASLAARLGEHGCNLLGVTVLPVAGEPTAGHEEGSVVDELMLRAPAASASSRPRLAIWWTRRRRCCVPWPPSSLDGVPHMRRSGWH